MAVVSSMKALIKSFTKYLKSTIINMFKTTLPTVCKYYSLNTKPFRLYPNSKETKRKVLSKSLSLIADQFFRCDFNNIRFTIKIIKRLQIADKILDLTYIKPVEPRRLALDEKR